jgi:hypothetical protein
MSTINVTLDCDGSEALRKLAEISDLLRRVSDLVYDLRELGVMRATDESDAEPDEKRNSASNN